MNNVGITCDACHSDRAYNKTSVLFSQSGQRVGYPGESSVLCGQCHQGRAWKGTVENKILAAYPAGDNDSTVDKITPSLTSSNSHYASSFAAIKASKSLIAVDYDLPIAVDLAHPGGTDCMVCHDQHSTEFRLDARCNTCHPSFESIEDVHAWGNADVLDAKQAQLYSVIRQYAADNTTEDADNNTKDKACIIQAGSSSWYYDTNCNGVQDAGETTTYKKFTPRLLRACYNYLVYKKDPGLFAHNSSYANAFLDASINDIRSYKPYPITDAQEATAEWELAGHADYNSMAFRDWDNASNPNAKVAAGCASCHSTSGFNQFCINGKRTVANPPLAVNNYGITCYACHAPQAVALTSVKFEASGQTVDNPGLAAVICGQCHQGRAWQATVDTQIKKAYPAGDNATTIDKISSKIGTSNPHYAAAFAASKASKSRIGYDYGDLTINVDSTHPGGTDCMACHNQHSTEVKVGTNCQPCHNFASLTDLVNQMDTAIPALETQLLALIEFYAADNTTLDAVGNTKAKACIVLDNAAYPYWFKDDGKNGDLTACDGVQDNPVSDNSYKSLTPRLARACYNLLVSLKDPGAFAHNEAYMRAVLQKSIDNLNAYFD